MLNKEQVLKLDLSKLTYLELKKLLPSTKHIKRLPFPLQLRNMKSNLLFSYKLSGCTIEVYDNGLYIYSSNGRETTYAVDRCNTITYSFDTGTQLVDESELGKFKWYIPLAQKGESRLEINSERTLDSIGKKPYENEIWRTNFTVNPFEELEEKRELEQDYARVRKAYTFLTSRQKQAVILYLKNERKSKEQRLNQTELGRQMGISHQVYSKLLKTAFKRLKKYF